MTVFYYTSEESEHLERVCVEAARCADLPTAETLRSWRTPGLEGSWLWHLCSEAADATECGMERGEHL